MPDKVWMKPPFGVGEPMEVDAAPEKLTPYMVTGWSQCASPSNEEVTTNVHD